MRYIPALFYFCTTSYRKSKEKWYSEKHTLLAKALYRRPLRPYEKFSKPSSDSNLPFAFFSRILHAVKQTTHWNREGGPMAGSKKITIAHVAEHAKVSSATVSRVLRHPELVNPSTVARVRKSLSELGYSGIAGQPAAGTSRRTIVVNIPWLDNPFYGEIMRGVFPPKRTVWKCLSPGAHPTTLNHASAFAPCCKTAGQRESLSFVRFPQSRSSVYPAPSLPCSVASTTPKQISPS